MGCVDFFLGSQYIEKKRHRTRMGFVPRAFKSLNSMGHG